MLLKRKNLKGAYFIVARRYGRLTGNNFVLMEEKGDFEVRKYTRDELLKEKASGEDSHLVQLFERLEKYSIPIN